jgi:hypothetical protein
MYFMYSIVKVCRIFLCEVIFLLEYILIHEYIYLFEYIHIKMLDPTQACLFYYEV